MAVEVRVAVLCGVFVESVEEVQGDAMALPVVGDFDGYFSVVLVDTDAAGYPDWAPSGWGRSLGEESSVAFAIDIEQSAAHERG
jgi:hypothetical protein